MTQRSVLTTQSKLTVQAPSVGSGVPAQCAVLGAWAAAHVLVRCPVSGVGRLNGSLLGCLRKDVALCDTASRAWVGERTVETTVERTAHFMRTVYMQVRDGSQLALPRIWGRSLERKFAILLT